jgi:hypothetical protein
MSFTVRGAATRATERRMSMTTRRASAASEARLREAAAGGFAASSASKFGRLLDRAELVFESSANAKTRPVMASPTPAHAT